MSLTGPPSPLPPVLAATGTAAEENLAAAISEILTARSPNSAASSVADVLHAASGPGNIITGKVVEIRPDGTVFLATQSGEELSLRHPPEVPLQLGSTVTLRLVSTVPVPQAMLLAVDGRSVAGLLARAAAAAPAPPSLQIAAPGPAGGTAIAARPAGPTDFGIGLAAPLVVTLGQDIIPPDEGQGSQGGIHAAVHTDPNPKAVSDPVVAVLVRAAPPKPGGTSPPTGTRYLLTVQAVSVPDAETDTPSTAPAVAPGQTEPVAPKPPVAALPVDVPAAAAAATTGQTEPAEPKPPAAAFSVDVPAAAKSALSPSPAVTANPPPVQQATTAPPDLAGFTPQTAILAGRAAAGRQPGEVMIETGLGTLALPLPATSIPAGSAVQLKIVAVARPLAAPATHAATPEPPVHPGALSHGPATPPAQTILQEALAVLTTMQPALAEITQTLLILPPGDRLAALIFRFLAGPRAEISRRWTESPARAALDAIDRSDLRERLDSDAQVIGTEVPPSQHGDWTVTVLPYLGASSVRLARLYRRSADVGIEGDGSKSESTGQRFVIELELQRLGQLQFDGFIRDRRFDLALRTAQPLEPALQSSIYGVFREAIGISGYAGELVFGKVGRFPLLPIVSLLENHEISA